MTPQQKIKAKILHNTEIEVPPDADIDEVYAKLCDPDNDNFDGVYDARCEMREGEVDTNIPGGYSRHYESKSVAAKMIDGSWVGWTYWYGGGKHGQPESIPWIEDAYDVDVTEEEKLVVVRTFKKK